MSVAHTTEVRQTCLRELPDGAGRLARMWRMRLERGASPERHVFDPANSLHRSSLYEPMGLRDEARIPAAPETAHANYYKMGSAQKQYQLIPNNIGGTLKHITATLATWDAVWEVYLDPQWAEQRLRLYGAQDRALEQFFKKLEEDMAEVSMERHDHAKQLVVFFGAAGIGTRGGWGADAVLRACCKVVCRTRGTDQRRGRVVLVDEHRTTRVSSAENGKQPSKRSKRTKAEPEAAEHTQPTKGKGKAQAARAKPAPQAGRWVDRDCNAALNMQRIGESKWRPLELCFWPKQGALPAKGKEYPGLGYKRLRDKPHTAQQQQPAVAQ
ncbi:hypothetical protein QJQ45_003414 [Haematococcus lacustris]|nr:hypothetical protein QJQ45_003414 [Haematococcus lacustris]